jgi:hypothetical protein
MDSSHSQDDLHAIQELRRMAHLYNARGNTDKAVELLQLVSSMERRINNEARIVDLRDFRDSDRNQEEHA